MCTDNRCVTLDWLLCTVCRQHSTSSQVLRAAETSNFNQRWCKLNVLCVAVMYTPRYIRYKQHINFIQLTKCASCNEVGGCENGFFDCRVTHSVNILLGSTKVSQRLWHRIIILYTIMPWKRFPYYCFVKVEDNPTLSPSCQIDELLASLTVCEKQGKCVISYGFIYFCFSWNKINYTGG